MPPASDSSAHLSGNLSSSERVVAATEDQPWNLLWELRNHKKRGAGKMRGDGENTGKVRLAYLVSHPIQYQAPLLRRIAQEPDIELTVFFGSDFSVKGYHDTGFGVSVQWDVPLLEGYKFEFLPTLRDTRTSGIFSPISYGIGRRLRGFDVLWVHGYSTANQLYGIVAARALGIPVLIRADVWLNDRPRGPLRLAAKRIFFRLLKQFVQGVLAVGTYNRQYWERYFGVDFPIFTMPYAVDNTFFQERCGQAAGHRDELRRELDLDPNRPVILYASKLQRRKHCHDLISAYCLLLSSTPPSQHPYLVIVGDGEERSNLERQVRESGVSGVRFCGFRNQSELPQFFDLCSVFVLPSRHEPWGLIVNEAMNAARPVIISDEVGCGPDLVRPGVEGFVFPAGDVSALTTCLGQVLRDPGAARAMGERALRRVDQWSFEEDVRALRHALGTVVRPRPSRSSHVREGSAPGRSLRRVRT